MSSGHNYPHESTGVETRKLGMWVFLSTEILFFANDCVICERTPGLSFTSNLR